MSIQMACPTDESIARIAHEINRAYCAATGDDSQLPWSSAPQWQRDSAINGVRFHIENPDVTAEQSHENWLKEKKAAGWVWGPVKNPDANPPEHPCFCRYDQLPVAQQVKDHLFKAVVSNVQMLWVY